MGHKLKPTVKTIDRVYKAAPLPFQGQKRFFVGPFAELLREYSRKHEIRCVVDLFGGSGLLAHTAKRVLPDCRVIFNDYDDYHVRLLNVAKTNKVLADLRAILEPYERGVRLCPAARSLVLQRIKDEAKTGYVDYISISSGLLFSGKYAIDFTDLESNTLYNRLRHSAFDVSPGDYLAGLEIFKTDYTELFRKFKDMPGVVFIVDPPYLTTDTKTYASDKYWKLKDYLNVLKVLQENSYVYFTSDKSSLVELCDWLEQNMALRSPFAGAGRQIHQNVINRQAKYNDMMLYRFAA